MKKNILQQYFKSQINNGGPATCALLLMNSFLKEKYHFLKMDECFPFKNNPIKQFSYFYKTIKKNNPDLVHIRGVQLEGFYGVLAAKLLRVKSVLSIDGLMIDAQNSGYIKNFLFYHFLEPFALRNADLTYAVCQAMVNREYVKRHTKHLYGYIHNAAPLYDLSNRKYDRKVKRNILGLKENEILLTNIGRITKEKGIDILLKSFKKLLEQHNNIRLCIAGEGDFLFEIKSKYKDLIETKKILLLGKITDVKEILLASDIFVFPTLHENLSNSLLEAATVGLPIVATSVGGNPEIIENNKTGLLVDSGNVSALTEALNKLIANKDFREDLGETVMKKVKKEFSQEKIFAEMDKMYEIILSRS